MKFEQNAGLSPAKETLVESKLTGENRLYEEVVDNASIHERLLKQISSQQLNTESLEVRPILDSSVFSDAELGLDASAELKWVQVDKIVGRPFADKWDTGWAHEYESRAGRVAAVEEHIKSGDTNILEDIFHNQKPDERIKLSAYDGPAGPIYDVEDGTHRVAGTMQAGLKEIPASVRRVKFPFSFKGRDAEQAQDIRNKIELDIIDGEIQEERDEEGKTIFTYTIRHEVLAWLHTTSQRDLIKISRMYEQLYPNALDGLSIPKDALIDPIANNYYLAGRWAEWEIKFKDHERTEQGIVKYDTI